MQRMLVARPFAGPLQTERLRNLVEQKMEQATGTIHTAQFQLHAVRFRWRPRIAKKLPGAILLMALPAIFVIVAVLLTKASGPHWLRRNFPNSYTYLFNSQFLGKNQTPFMIEHPGTVTQLLGEA